MHAIKFFWNVHKSSNIWISLTLICKMTKFFATITLFAPQFFFFVSCVLIIVVLFCFVLLVLTTWSILFCFSTAPPHLASEFTSVSAAGPIVILVFTKFFVAVTTKFFVEIKVFSVCPKFCNFGSKSFQLSLHYFNSLLLSE